jgi:multidrug transporter EmrE-like cation transporter
MKLRKGLGISSIKNLDLSNMYVKYILVILGILTSAFAQIFLKISANKSDDIVNLYLNPYVLGGIISYGISFILYIYILKKFPLSSISPIMVGGTTAIVLIAAYFMGESITSYKLLGIFAIVFGIWIIFTS